MWGVIESMQNNIDLQPFIWYPSCMLNHSFRDYHLLQLLELYHAGTVPIDVTICQYFRKHKALGSKDRYTLGKAYNKELQFLKAQGKMRMMRSEAGKKSAEKRQVNK